MSKDRDVEQLTELIGRAAEGDSRSYGRLFRLCYQDIYDYIARRVGNPSDAEDLTMQVFSRGLKAVGSYEERGHSARAWLFRIAHNAVVDHFRALRQEMDIAEVGDLAAETNVEEDVAVREQLRELYEHIRTLPVAQAEVLVLRFVEDMSVTEVATILGKKEVTVRALQFKGIKNLRQRIEGQASVAGSED